MNSVRFSLATALWMLGCGAGGQEADAAPDSGLPEQASTGRGAQDAAPATALIDAVHRIDASPDGARVADGAAGADAASTPSCTPLAGADEPDDGFADTDCDGIDGDASKAVFVAPTGDDAHSGAMGSPVRTLGRAVALAAPAELDVYVCNATYVENVTISAGGVRIFGGYDCADGWKRGERQALVAPVRGTALSIRGVTGPVVVDRMVFRSPDALSPGESSVAAIVYAAPDVKLSHVRLEAGDGAEGMAGAVQSGLAQPAPGARGEDLPVLYCDAWSPSPACLSVDASGGADPSPSGCQYGGAGGQGASPLHEATPGAAGGGALRGSIGQPGAAGNPGTRGAIGIGPAYGFGSVSNLGYKPTNVGTDGSAGTPGQGGGGGAGGTKDCCGGHDGFCELGWFYGGGGGQGGPGGCGGAGGKGGGGGGASIALLVIDSDVALSSSLLKTATGGSGGRPSAGAPGQPGGAPGEGGKGTRCNSAAASNGNGFAGGAGGRGGDGGAGGPGGGGPSIGVLSSGLVPVVTGPTFQIGAGGTGGTGILRPKGLDGISKDQMTVDAIQR
jgi:hypothetical protein